MKKIDYLLAGVGGQGTILASRILASAGLELGYDVKTAEVHGMAQRGGSVESHVRWGKRSIHRWWSMAWRITLSVLKCLKLPAGLPI